MIEGCWACQIGDFIQGTYRYDCCCCYYWSHCCYYCRCCCYCCYYWKVVSLPVKDLCLSLLLLLMMMMMVTRHTPFYDGIFQQKGRERLTPTSPRSNPFCWKTPSKKEYGVLTTLWRAFVSLWHSIDGRSTHNGQTCVASLLAKLCFLPPPEPRAL